VEGDVILQVIECDDVLTYVFERGGKAGVGAKGWKCIKPVHVTLDLKQSSSTNSIHQNTQVKDEHIPSQ
jgi:hypothetical protein